MAPPTDATEIEWSRSSSSPSKKKKIVKRKKKVTFALTETVVGIENALHFAADEVAELWWSKEDYEEMLKEQQSVLVFLNMGIAIDGRLHSPRGLEKETVEGAIRRYEARKAAREAVLSEQLNQQKSEQKDPLAIAMAYYHQVRGPRHEARNQAKIDAEEAMKCHASRSRPIPTSPKTPRTPKLPSQRRKMGRNYASLEDGQPLLNKFLGAPDLSAAVANVDGKAKKAEDFIMDLKHEARNEQKTSRDDKEYLKRLYLDKPSFMPEKIRSSTPASMNAQRDNNKTHKTPTKKKAVLRVHQHGGKSKVVSTTRGMFQSNAAHLRCAENVGAFDACMF
jgi:hypothetical protein